LNIKKSYRKPLHTPRLHRIRGKSAWFARRASLDPKLRACLCSKLDEIFNVDSWVIGGVKIGSIFFSFSIPVYSHWPKIDLHTKLKKEDFWICGHLFPWNESQGQKSIGCLTCRDSPFIQVRYTIFRSIFQTLNLRKKNYLLN